MESHLNGRDAITRLESILSHLATNPKDLEAFLDEMVTLYIGLDDIGVVADSDAQRAANVMDECTRLWCAPDNVARAEREAAAAHVAQQDVEDQIAMTIWRRERIVYSVVGLVALSLVGLAVYAASGAGHLGGALIPLTLGGIGRICTGIR
jgi:hypothetical protein